MIKKQPSYYKTIVLFFVVQVIAASLVALQVKAAEPSKNKVETKATGLVVGRIEVEGNRKLEKDAILNKIRTKLGEATNEELIREDVQAIFRTGFFHNVIVQRKVEGNQVVLTYLVTEKPSIVEINYAGNSELKDEELAEAAGVKPFEILNQAKVKEAVEKLQKLYEDKGFFLAKVESKIEEVKPEETVKLSFDISENDKVRVKKITFLGNKKLTDGFLKNKMLTKEGGYFSFLSGSGAYKQEAFDRDVQALRFMYFNEGYIQVKVDRPQVYVTPDKKSIYITIKIEEGDQFNVGEIDFSGDMLYSRDELFNSITIDKSKVFSYETLQKDIAELQAKYGDLGYAFANVIPRIKTHEAEKKVDVTFEFDKGNKVYFGLINVVGNSKTRDKVLRRELKIREGELYNETRRRESYDNINRLGFFEEVTFKTSTPADKPDILNIDIVVKERSTGTIQLGAGYGSATGFTMQGQINQPNFLGKGQKLGASLNVNNRGSYFNLNFTEPYFMDSQWSVGYDLYQSISDRDAYSEKKTGGAVRFGHPIMEFLNYFVRYKYDVTNLEPEKDINGVDVTDRSVFPIETAEGVTSSVTLTLEYDKRNDRFSPSKGLYGSSSLEYAGIGGDLKYTKTGFTAKYFKKIVWDVVWRNNLTYGILSSHQPGKEPPFNETYLLGGAYSLRGYYYGQVGKRVFSQKSYDTLISKSVNEQRAREMSMRPFGGKQQLYYSAELEFPMIQEAGIKGVIFYDIGQAEDTIGPHDWYSDMGFGMRWFSPIGPLRFEWGFPLLRDPAYHEPVVFEFSIGSPF